MKCGFVDEEALGSDGRGIHVFISSREIMGKGACIVLINLVITCERTGSGLRGQIAGEMLRCAQNDRPANCHSERSEASPARMSNRQNTHVSFPVYCSDTIPQNKLCVTVPVTFFETTPCYDERW